MSAIPLSKQSQSINRAHGQQTDGLQSSAFHCLPNEILRIIISHIPPEQQHTAAQTCRVFKQLVYKGFAKDSHREGQVAAALARQLVKQKDQELIWVLRLRRLQVDQTVDWPERLQNLVMFCLQLLKDASLESLARLNSASCSCEKSRVGSCLEKAILRRWQALIEEETIGNGFVKLPWYLRFNQHSFRLFSTALQQDNRVRELRIESVVPQKALEEIDLPGIRVTRGP